MSTTTVTTISHFINGAETAGEGTRTQPVYNPATGAVSAELRLANREDLDTTVAAARAAADSWGDISLAKRTAVLFKFRELVASHVDELAELITAEHGKVLSDAKGEIGRGLEVIEFACGIPQLLKGDYSDQVSTGIDVFSFREPLGVVAGITPFNFPVMVPLWMAPMAIATGNAFILKPSERDPSASMLLAKLWKQAGLPDGVFQVLHGDKETVDGLLTHPDVDGISFVGSTPIAKYVHETATAHGKRVQALGGAKNHAIILPDADLDNAADHLAAAAFGSAGERCMAISVAVAVGEAADLLVKKVEERALAVKVNNGTVPDAEMGPVITPASKERIVKIVTEAETAGAAMVVDGRDLVVPGHEDGLLGRPHRPGPRHGRDDRLHRGNLRPRPGRGPRGGPRRRHRPDQLQPLRQRHRDLHLLRRRGPEVPALRHRGHDRHQRAAARAGGVPLLRRLEGLAVRRQAHLRPRRRLLLHPRQGGHLALARTHPRLRRLLQLPVQLTPRLTTIDCSATAVLSVQNGTCGAIDEKEWK